MKKFILTFLLSIVATSIYCSSYVLGEKPKISKNHVLFLMRSKKIKSAIEQYESYKSEQGKHDFALLQEMSYLLLEQGAKSEDSQTQILSMYGAYLSKLNSAIDIFDIGISSREPMIQLAAIQLSSRMQDDRCEDILIKAFSSDYLPIRFEAAFELASRKSKYAVGLIESLMHKLPPFFKPFFADLFARIGTQDATHNLSRLVSDPNVDVRATSFLAAAKYGRDDFLSIIKSAATHLNMAEQESAAAALGILQDSKSIEILKKLATSQNINVQLAACKSLISLGASSYSENIIALARNKNLFAVAQLGNMDTGNTVLKQLIEDKDRDVRLNAGIALLKRRDPSCINAILPILVPTSSDLGFAVQGSIGRSLVHWKTIPSATQYMKKTKRDIASSTRSLRQETLLQSVELGNDLFLQIAKLIFISRQHDLIPLLVQLLENVNTEDVKILLKEQSNHVGAPFIRGYCNLALFRIDKSPEYEEKVFAFLKNAKNADIIRINQGSNRLEAIEYTPFQLNPEETSMLLIEAFQTLSNRHEEKSIDLLLSTLKNGEEKNRYVIAGLLANAIH